MMLLLLLAVVIPKQIQNPLHPQGNSFLPVPARLSSDR